MIARVAVMSVVLVVALLLQTVLAPAIEIAGIRPDPVLLTVVGFALADGPGTGARYGFAAGLAVDLLSGTGLPLGAWALALCLSGYGVGQLRRYLTGTDLVGQLAAATAAAVVAVGLAGILAVLLDTGGVTLSALLRAAVGTALYNLPFVPLVVTPVTALSHRFTGNPALTA